MFAELSLSSQRNETTLIVQESFKLAKQNGDKNFPFDWPNGELLVKLSPRI